MVNKILALTGKHRSGRWEHGSEFHWLSSWKVSKSHMPWGNDYLLFGTGRQVLQALIKYGQLVKNWRRLWIPSYFCQTVVSAILSTGIVVQTYPDTPLKPEPDFRKLGISAGDVVLLVNFFGLRKKIAIQEIDRNAIDIIEDHTHDPWSQWAWASNADYCLASLRKTLPIPDGGVLWSPIGQQLPQKASLTPEHKLAALEKFSSMVMKSLYLKRYPIDKEMFRRLAISGEEGFENDAISGASEVIEIISSFPIATWREKRGINHRTLSDFLADLDLIRILQPEKHYDSVPFSACFIFESKELLSNVREKLISANIYPAILWPLNKPVIAGITEQEIELSQRMFSIHCDMRYNQSDMEYLAFIIKKLISQQ